MEPRISVPTLGVADLERSLSFYHNGLGLATKGIVGQEFEHGAVAFFDLSGGLKLALWAQADIAHDTELPMRPVSPTAFTIGHNVMRREEVDQIMDAAEQAGAEIVKPPQDTFYGAMPAIFAIPTDICGKSSGTRTCFPRAIEQPSGGHRP